MRIFIVFVLFFLVIVLFITNGLGNIDLTPDTSEVAQASAPITTQPQVITIQESPTTTISEKAFVPMTGACANSYIVVLGDWLIKIARYCDTSLAAILQINPQIINEDLIYPDQQISIPNADASAVALVPATGLFPTIQSGGELQVQAIHLLPNTPVNIAIGPENVGYTVVTSAVTDAAGSLTTHLTIPNAPDPRIPWVVAVVTTSEVPVQIISAPFYIE